MNQPTIILSFILCLLVLAVPRKVFFVPIILCACFIPADQRVIIFNLDFTPLRMLVIAGFLRMLMRMELGSFTLNYFDKLILGWSICGVVVYLIQQPDTKALIYKSGQLFDVIGFYLLFRMHISSWGDIKLATKIFAVCSLIMAVLVGMEWATEQNPFEVLGRVSATIREGRYRCQASFPHSIILGLFWATLVPLFIGFAQQSKHKLLFWSALAASIFIAPATGSSTPILTLLSVLLLMCIYKCRKYTSLAAWGLFVLLAFLHIVMTKPVWHLVCRVGVVGGSTGWHRYYLIDEGISHINEWILLGCRGTSHWGRGLGDVTNQYLLEGVRGGLATLVLFLLVLYMALKTFLKISLQSKDSQHRFLAWCFFVTIIGHCISFFGVSYFGQIKILLYFIFACAGFAVSSEGNFSICETDANSKIKGYTSKHFKLGLDNKS